ncbi:MAG: patatin-like phospholipase family protein [Candidatus Nitrosocosmicus sp.]
MLLDKYSKNNRNNNIQLDPETVLVNQGGGSLGAYECGVSKVLAKHDIRFDIIAGSSIGAINATILASNYSYRYGLKNSALKLENFWLELGEKMIPFCTDKQKSEFAALMSLFWGNSNAFTPIWLDRGGFPQYYFFNSPYLYDVDRLKKTINKYVNFDNLHNTNSQKQQSKERNTESRHDVKIKDNTESNNQLPRLIITATNIQTGEPVTFDSYKMNITIDHIMASAGYAIYGLPWTKIDNNYYWDGSFVHNTPLKSAIDISPSREKIAYVSDVFPLKQKKLPNSMPETYHRVRDLLFTDISIREITQLSDIIKEDLSVIEQMRKMLLENNNIKDEKTRLKLEAIEKNYNKILSSRKGFIINKLVHIERKESIGHHFLFEDADFSIATIERLIKQGEKDAELAILESH